MPPKASKHHQASRAGSSSPSPSPSSSSRFSNSPKFSPSAFPIPKSPSLPFQEDDPILVSLHDSAVRKFPSFISKSALVARIAHVTSPFVTHCATVWLPESAMAAASILPGALVSVSLPAASNNTMSGFPLTSFSDEYGKHKNITLSSEAMDSAGSFFALAVAFSSCKVLKNEVKFSWSLSCTMGGPTLGRTAFVSPIQSQNMVGKNSSFYSDIAGLSPVSFWECKDLYLKLVHFDNVSASSNENRNPIDIVANTSNDIFQNFENLSPVSSYSSRSTLTSKGLHKSLPSPDSSNETSNMSAIEMIIEEERNKGILESFFNCWLSSRTLLLGNLVAIPICGQVCTFFVDKATESLVDSSSGNLTCKNKYDSSFVSHDDVALLIGRRTRVHLSSTGKCISTRGFTPAEEEKDLAVIKLGGLSKEKEIICEKIRHCAKYTGILIHGPPGTGKTSLIRACVHDAGVKLFSIKGPEIITEDYGKSEQALLKVFDNAKQEAPAVVFIDELDALAPAQKEGGEPLSRRMLAALLDIMEEISTSRVLVIGSTNQPDNVHSDLRQHGRFDREIEIGVPSPDQRLEILLVHLSEKKHSLSENEAKVLASRTHGHVGADIASLCNEAALNSLRRYVRFKKLRNFDQNPKYNGIVEDVELKHKIDCLPHQLSNLHISSEPDTPFTCSNNAANTANSLEDNLLSYHSNESALSEEGESLPTITLEDFENAMKKVRPSAMREVMIEIPNVSWEDIGGQEEVKNQLREVVEWPQKYQKLLEEMGVPPPTGVLMFGPPGCSKTLLARAVASNSGLNFLSVKGPELFSKWVGESEKSVQKLFKKAQAAAPSIIFFDEIDALASTRGKEKDGASVGDRVLSQLLVELNGMTTRDGVIVIAATNRPDKIDPAILRAGRFDRHLYVGPPSEGDREAVFRIHLRRVPCSSDVSLKELAHLTEGYTGADIYSICQTAAFVAMEENMDGEVSMTHFKVAIGTVKPSEVQSYEVFSDKFERLVRYNHVDNSSAG